MLTLSILLIIASAGWGICSMGAWFLLWQWMQAEDKIASLEGKGPSEYKFRFRERPDETS